MDILPSEEEQMLKNVAREFLEAEVSPALVREMELDNLGYPPALWQQLADLGWLGLAIPQEFGGQGLPLTYLGMVLEEAGRVLAPVPLHSSRLCQRCCNQSELLAKAASQASGLPPVDQEQKYTSPGGIPRPGPAPGQC